MNIDDITAAAGVDVIWVVSLGSAGICSLLALEPRDRLFYDTRTNVPLYPTWQTFLRDRQPKTMISGAGAMSSSPRKAARPT